MHCFIIAALTVDGFLADKTDQNSFAWTSKEDKAYFVKRTKAAGAVVFGSTTYQTIGRPLKDRLNLVYSSRPEKITRSKPLPLTGQLDPTIPYTTMAPPAKLLTSLDKLGVKEVAICGGASIYTLFMAAKVVNTLYITVEPVLFGTGINLFTQKMHALLKLQKTTPLSPQSNLMEYTVA